jgi:hypothetical protein
MYVCTYVGVYVCIYLRIYVRRHVCMSVCICARVPLSHLKYLTGFYETHYKLVAFDSNILQ